MISLKATIDKLDLEYGFRIAVDCYLGAIVGMQEHAIGISPELTRDYRLAMRTLHRDLSDGSDFEALENSRAKLDKTLQDYQTKSTAIQQQKDEDLRALLTMLGEAAENLCTRNDDHSGRLKTFTQQLQAVARGTDLGQMRRELTKQLLQMRVVGDSMWKENHLSVTSLQAQLTHFQQRLDHAEKRAATDALTGLMNRGEGEVRFRAQVEAGATFSAILIDLDGFKQINDRWGHSCGDQVLRIFGRKLAQTVRPSDTVCRWGGDEFLMILQGDESLGFKRAEQLRERLNGRCTIVVLGNQFEVEIRISLGIAQARAGESSEDILARADSDLYRDKTRG